ncbi:MAG: RDD family protein [Burkholderiales bacterium]
MTVASATPSLGRRLLCLVYEALLLTAVILVAGGLATALAKIAGLNQPRILTRMIVVIACAGYYAVQWLRRGQTLPMKTWRISLETTAGGRITPLQALMRMTLATIGYPVMGVTILWSFIDRDRQFLHDRLSGTRLVTVAPPP